MYVQDHSQLKVGIVAANSRAQWRDNRSLHLVPSLNQDGVYAATCSVVIDRFATPTVIAAMARSRPLSVDLTTDAPFNIWESLDGPILAKATLFNGGRAREVQASWVAHDYDGTTVASGSAALHLDAGAIGTVEIEVSLQTRGIAFLEVTARSGSDLHYARTNLAVLPPHEFTDRGSSIFGIAPGYVINNSAERDLLRRLGVRHSRHTFFTAEQLREYGFTQHRLRTMPSLHEHEGDSKGLDAYVESELDTAEARHAIAYELGNELNRWGDGPYTGDGADLYTRTWVRAFRRGLRRRGSDLKLVAAGLAGMDVRYARAMFRAGLSQYADAFNLHPGRQNVTPDWAPDWRRVSSGADRSWSYYAALKEARGLIDEYAPDMELWLTEVYACTRPNAWWDDSYRHAAENIILSAALALTVGVTKLLWFQLYDNTASDRYGARADDREHHFGLVLRDLSPKPSLLAFAAATEHFDGAQFKRWLAFDQDTVFGLEFSTPRGALAVLWTRADGYELNSEQERDGSFYPSPEAWVETWRTKTKVRVKAKAKMVTEIDSIGRRRSIPARQGYAVVQLDGAPRMYYGLDTSAIEGARDVPGGLRQSSPEED
ncbi:hypothetical protein [Microbacterium sp. KNMS]